MPIVLAMSSTGLAVVLSCFECSPVVQHVPVALARGRNCRRQGPLNVSCRGHFVHLQLFPLPTHSFAQSPSSKKTPAALFCWCRVFLPLRVLVAHQTFISHLLPPRIDGIPCQHRQHPKPVLQSLLTSTDHRRTTKTPTSLSPSR